MLFRSGKPNASTVITVVRQIVALIPFIYLLPMFLQTMGIFYAQPISDLIATLISIIIMIKAFKEMSQKEEKVGEEAGVSLAS